jgi:hypothetical protein
MIVLHRIWSCQLSEPALDYNEAIEMLEMLTQFPRLEASRVAEMVKILPVVLPKLRQDPSWSSFLGLSCDWLLQRFRDFPTYPMMSEVIEATDEIRSLNKTTQHWILHHELIRTVIQMVNELIGFPDVAPPRAFYLFVTKCLELLGPAEGVLLLQLIDQGSYLRLLTRSPAGIAYPCLKMVALFILWDRPGAELFSDGFFYETQVQLRSPTR